MSQAPTTIEFVVRIGDVPPPPSALDRWSDATWSHHADPLDGLVELGRRVFESRAKRAWTAEHPTRIAVLITLRAATAELAAAIASHLPGVQLWIASSTGDLVAIDEAASRDSTSPSSSAAPANPPERPRTPPNAGRGDPHTVSSEEIRLLLGDATEDPEPDRPEAGS